MSEPTKHAQLYESLSALVDDEASELEVHRLLAESEKDPSLRTRWYRYQLARAALRGDVVAASVDLSDSIREAISRIDQQEFSGSEEPVVADDSPAPRKAWWANAGRFAIAASVAGVVLITAQQMNWMGGQAGLPAVAETNQPTAPVSTPSSLNSQAINVETVSSGDSLVPSSSMRSTPPASSPLSSEEQQRQHEEQIRQYLQSLMREHAESASQNNATGLMPYVRVPGESGDGAQ